MLKWRWYLTLKELFSPFCDHRFSGKAGPGGERTCHRCLRTFIPMPTKEK